MTIRKIDHQKVKLYMLSQSLKINEKKLSHNHKVTQDLLVNALISDYYKYAPVTLKLPRIK